MAACSAWRSPSICSPAIKGINPLSLGDIASAATPFGLFFGRVANFINAEVVGRVSDVPWAMVFPGAGDEPRHPSQLYEAFLEGIVLFIILRIATHRYHALTRPGTVFGLFLVFYGLFRSLAEFVREPHAGHPLDIGILTPGIAYSIPMILIGAVADLAGAAAAGFGDAVMGAQRETRRDRSARRLRPSLRERIAREGPISVHDYMEACLADRERGLLHDAPADRNGRAISSPRRRSARSSAS